VTDGVDDLVQQTFLACVNRKDHLDDALGFRPYLFAVARSKLFDRLRTLARMPQIDGGTISVADLGVTPSAVLSDRDDEAMVVEALRQLPLDLQVALELYYFESMRGPALAQVLAVPEGTARTRLRRGLQLLREHIERMSASAELRQKTDTTLASWARALRDGDAQ
jgi:RNA polymerase sigma-70 factor (ECF subfamily)